MKPFVYKHKALVTAVIILLLILILAILLLLSQSNITNNQVKNEYQETISSPYIQNSKSQILEFKLNQTNIASQMTGKTENFTFESKSNTEVKFNKPNAGTIIFSGDKFSLIMYTYPENFGGMLDVSIEHKIIENISVPKIMRVLDSSDGYAEQTLSRYGNWEYHYYYMNYGERNKDCTGTADYDFYCATDGVEFPIENTKASLRIYCGVNNKDDSSICDDIISNLAVTSVAEEIKPLSYFE